jgi:hypothetical protein
MERIERSERPYLRYAFLNPYNLTLLLAGIAAGFLTGHHWLVVITCGAEALWLIFAPDSKILQHIWFDRAFDDASRIERDESRKEKIARLSASDTPRVARLLEQKGLIERLARDNPSLAVDLLQNELVKLDALLDDFIDLGVAASRAETHSLTFDFDAMRRSWHVHERLVKSHPIGDRRREVAEKNLDVLRRRRARYDELVRQLQVLRGQMELIEQTFRLLADEILTMGSPRELGGRIDELRVAVDAVRETAGDAYEDMLEGEEVGHEAAR